MLMSHVVTSRQITQRGAIVLLLALFLGLAVIISLWVFRPQHAVRPQSSLKPPLVEVWIAKPQSHRLHIQTQGTVIPRREINLVAEVSGRVVSVSPHFVAGGFFDANETLLQLDQQDYEYALLSAKSSVANAERDLALERGQARQARREWRDLGSKEANDLFLRKPQVKAAEALLSSAKAAQSQAQLNLQRSSISAPFSGRVVMTQADLGQYVAQGSSVGSIYDSNQVEVRLPLSKKQLANTDIELARLSTRDNNSNLGPMITLSADFGGQVQQWQARITRVDSSIDPATRFFTLVATVDQPFNTEIHPQPLMVGLFVHASIPGRQYPRVIQLPSQAVIQNQLFTVDDANILQRKFATIIAKKGDTVWVAADTVTTGEGIVVSDPRVLREGMEVATQLVESDH